MVSIGFTSDELSSLSLTSDEIIESLGSQPVASDTVVGYTSDQVQNPTVGDPHIFPTRTIFNLFW